MKSPQVQRKKYDCQTFNSQDFHMVIHYSTSWSDDRQTGCPIFSRLWRRMANLSMPRTIELDNKHPFLAPNASSPPHPFFSRSPAHALIVSYRLLALIFGPHLKNTHGMGSITTETKPRRLVAQPMPRAPYTVLNISVEKFLSSCAL